MGDYSTCMGIVTSSADSVPSGPVFSRRWQDALKQAVKDPVQLCAMLQLPGTWHQAARGAAARFPVLVPLEYIARMRPGDPRDPLLRQVLPMDEELDDVPGYEMDPVGDLAATRCPGLLQKYAQRALIVTTGACAVHCRYCFRSYFSHADAGSSADRWQPALEQLAQDRSIQEVVLSGGDPLVLSDRLLEKLLQQLATISHLRRVRIHTRLPIMIPQRVTHQLVAVLKACRLTCIVVVHANHPAELGSIWSESDRPVATDLGRSCVEPLGRLIDAGIPVLNQAVLLRGVNDRLETLVGLSQRLIDLRIMPYYLHQLDPVRGAARFFVPLEQGVSLVRGMRAELPGYAVPRFVRETPGASSKEVLA